jgi:hypothetical protein
MNTANHSNPRTRKPKTPRPPGQGQPGRKFSGRSLDPTPKNSNRSLVPTYLSRRHSRGTQEARYGTARHGTTARHGAAPGSRPDSVGNLFGIFPHAPFRRTAKNAPQTRNPPNKRPQTPDPQGKGQPGEKFCGRSLGPDPKTQIEVKNKPTSAADTAKRCEKHCMGTARHGTMARLGTARITARFRLSLFGKQFAPTH